MLTPGPARLLTPAFYPRPWGRRDLRGWYPERGPESEPIGEAWLTQPGCPVLVKMLFTAQPVSVQVHPDDAYAAAHGLSGGKSEAWLVLEAETGARLGLGLKPGADWPGFAAACRRGQGAEWLNWLPVAPGDLIDVPAGTVHALGAGLVLLEVQQPSDITFRLDDYGRGRPLHLDHGMAVARATRAGKVPVGLGAGKTGVLLETPYFSLRRHCIAAGWEVAPAAATRWIVNVSEPSDEDSRALARGHLLELQSGTPWIWPQGRATLIEIRSGELGVDPNRPSRENGD